MRVGLRLPGAGPWAGPDAIADVAKYTEEVGFDSLWMTDHVALPTKIETEYPYSADGSFLWDPATPYLDTFMTLAWAAAATERVTIGTSVLILPWRPLVHTAKQIVSLDVLTKGRLILGVGVGWMREQFELLDADFSNRGPRTTEAIAVLRHMWNEDEVDFSGEYHDLHGFKMYPKPVRGTVPVWIGGTSTRVLERVAKVGDGWNPLAITPDELREKKTILIDLLEQNGRTIDEITLAARPMHKIPLNEETLHAYSELGVTELICDTSFGHGEMADAMKQIEDLAENVLPTAHTLPS
jgi:probable F420-dependent oxidoreductase